MMHPEISRELSRAQQQERLRDANPAARVLREMADDRRPRERRRWRPLAWVARSAREYTAPARRMFP